MFMNTVRNIVRFAADTGNTNSLPKHALTRHNSLTGVHLAIYFDSKGISTYILLSSHNYVPALRSGLFRDSAHERIKHRLLKMQALSPVETKSVLIQVGL